MPTTKPTVAIIEDNANLANLIQRRLTKAGFDVVGSLGRARLSPARRLALDHLTGALGRTRPTHPRRRNGAYLRPSFSRRFLARRIARRIDDLGRSVN